MIKIKSIEERTPFGVRFSLHNPIALAPLMPDIIAGGAGVLSSLLGGFFGRKSQSDTNATNLQIARETNQMQLQAMREQNAFNERASIDAFNRENAYNSPYAQAQRMLEAGFSPSVALGSGTIQSSIGNQTAPSSSGLPSFVTPTLTAPPSVMVGAIDSISKLAGAAAQISQSKKTNKETSWLDEQIDAQIKSMFAKIGNDEAQAQYTRTLDLIQFNYGDKDMETKIAKAYSETYLNYLKGETEQADAAWKRFEASISEVKADREKKLTPFILSEAEESVKLIKEQQETERSKQESNHASAVFNNALKKTEDELRGSKKEQIENDIKNGKFGRALSVLDSYMRAAGYNQPIWNIGANEIDNISEGIKSIFGSSKRVEEFIKFIESQVGD